MSDSMVYKVHYCFVIIGRAERRESKDQRNMIRLKERKEQIFLIDTNDTPTGWLYQIIYHDTKVRSAIQISAIT